MIDRNFKFILFFSFFYFLICFYLSLSWYDKGYFSVLDIFFDTDPSSNLGSFAHGWGRHAISHAFLELFSIPIRIIEMIYANFFVVTDRREFRDLIALSISPAFSSLTLVYLYRVLLLLNIKRFDANILTLIFAVSFTNIIFAVIPETYAISCFFIAYLIYYFLNANHFECSGNKFVWLGLAILLSGITVTNICIFYLVFMVHLVKNEKLNYFDACKKATSFSFLALVSVIIFYKGSHFLLDYKTGTEGGSKWIAKFMVSSLEEFTSNIVNLFSSLINSFVGVFPKLTSNSRCIDFSCNAISFTRDKSDYIFLGFVAVILSAFISSLRKFILDKRWRSLYIICILIIAFNFLLHALFGREMFMYSKHWIMPLFLLLVPTLENKRLLSASLLLSLIIINIDFLLNVEKLVALN